MTYQPTEDEQRLLIRYAAQVQASGVCAYPELELHLRHFDQQRRQQPGAQVLQQENLPGESTPALEPPPEDGPAPTAAMPKQIDDFPSQRSHGAPGPHTQQPFQHHGAAQDDHGRDPSNRFNTDSELEAKVLQLVSRQMGRPPGRSAAALPIATASQNPEQQTSLLDIGDIASGPRQVPRHIWNDPNPVTETAIASFLQRFRTEVQRTGRCDHPELAERLTVLNASAELHPGDCGQALAILLRNNTKRLQQLRQRCASDSNEQGRTSDCLLGVTVALRHVQRNLQDGFRSFGGALHDPLRRMIGDQLKRAGTLLRRLERGHRHQHPQGLLLGLQQNLLDSFEFLIEQWQTATPR